ncbi:MAG: TlpA family protein disulfide reductase, partial [Acidimicrobiales bacterium]|nr:TlpA family protein disulfide reductase [Acidimicrobiales bacterium]
VLLVSILLSLGVLSLAACGGGSKSNGSSNNGASDKGLPDAELTDLRTEELVDWNQGSKPLVINMWASWCAPCRKEMPAFDKVAQDLQDQVKIIGVTDDLNRDSALKAADKSKVTYPLLYDEEAILLTELDISGLPATVFVDEKGKIIGKHLGELTESELRQEIEKRYGISS